MLDFIPMPHQVTIEKANTLDDWGLPVADGQSSFNVRAKIRYNTNREAISTASGEQVVYKATILLGGLPEVRYEDFVTWTDDFGYSHRKHPLEIDYKQDLSGTPVAVKVVV